MVLSCVSTRIAIEQPRTRADVWSVRPEIRSPIYPRRTFGITNIASVIRRSPVYLGHDRSLQAKGFFVSVGLGHQAVLGRCGLAISVSTVSAASHKYLLQV